MKRNLQATAKAFQAEGKVSSDPVGMHLYASCLELLFSWSSNSLCSLSFVKSIIYFPQNCSLFFSAIDAPGGFLFEWWSVFWDIFIARTNEKHSDVAASYIEVNIFLHLIVLSVIKFYLTCARLTYLLLFVSPSTKSILFCACKSTPRFASIFQCNF
jgi:hypothetical protein